MALSMSGVQHLGRSLMLPIAVLPIAGLLLRLGQPDLLGVPFVSSAGDAIFTNLGLLFAIGVAVGFAKENHGAAGLAGVVAFLVATSGAKTLIVAPDGVAAGLDAGDAAIAIDAYKEQAIAKLGVPVGIICGVIAGLFYNRYADIKLPEYLAFFGGRRFVPIVSGCAGLVLAVVFGYGWSGVEAAMDGASRAIVEAGGFGLFVYGILNRILIVTGLHHILNNAAWFIIGDYEGVTGDLRRFFAGDPSAGAFMSGFFPVMMFGLPAACLAMYRAAAPENRKAVGGLYLSMALTSFLTGITEPIEFTFMFLAPVLYAIHAAFTGFSMFLMDVLNVRLGFGFSAGLFDYVLNFNKASNPLLLLPVGAAYFALYYVMFSACIRWFNLKTPGRDDAGALLAGAASMGDSEKARALIAALGGAGNLHSVGACTTRLRLVIGDQGAVDEAALKLLGARGFIRPSADTLQIVFGPTAELISADVNAVLGGASASFNRGAQEVSASAPAVSPADDGKGFDPALAENLLAALGGKENLKGVATLPGRIIATLCDRRRVNLDAMNFPGIRGAAFLGAAEVHVLVHERADRVGRTLQETAALSV